MNSQLLNDIKKAALEFWIDYNYEVAQGRKEGEEWLDTERSQAEEIEVWGKEESGWTMPELSPVGYRLWMKIALDQEAMRRGIDV